MLVCLRLSHRSLRLFSFIFNFFFVSIIYSILFSLFQLFSLFCSVAAISTILFQVTSPFFSLSFPAVDPFQCIFHFSYCIVQCYFFVLQFFQVFVNHFLYFLICASFLFPRSWVIVTIITLNSFQVECISPEYPFLLVVFLCLYLVPSSGTHSSALSFFLTFCVRKTLFLFHRQLFLFHRQLSYSSCFWSLPSGERGCLKGFTGFPVGGIGTCLWGVEVCLAHLMGRTMSECVCQPIVC